MKFVSNKKMISKKTISLIDNNSYRIYDQLREKTNLDKRS